MNSAEGSSSSSSTNASCLQMDNRQIGSGGGRNGGKVSKKTWNGVGFTFMQMEELKQQAMIYKYMEAGVPVPSHLILPIWKSVLTSSGLTGRHMSTLQQWNREWYTVLLQKIRFVQKLGDSDCIKIGMGCNSSLYYNYKNSLEAEPGRCKRTDGKKWRCSKDVVPDHKYCERHLHRGRSRSRKPVETDAFAATANNPMTIYDGSNNMRSKISPRLGLVQPQDFLCGENIKAYDWQIQ